MSETRLLLLPEYFPSPLGSINVSEPAITALTKYVINYCFHGVSAACKRTDHLRDVRRITSLGPSWASSVWFCSVQPIDSSCLKQEINGDVANFSGSSGCRKTEEFT